MKMKYSALVSATSGKLNGSVAASNRGGAYLRNKGVTSNPQTPSQQANRSIFASVSSQFRDLTESQVNAWNTAAADFPVIDRFGDTRYLSGLALFVQLNKNLIGIGSNVILNPPAKQAFPAIIGLSPVVEVTAGVISDFVLTANALENVPAGFTMQVRATPSLPASISFVKNRYRNIGNQVATGSTDIEFTNSAAYVSNFGVPIVGQRIYFEITLISSVSGEKSAPFIDSVVVTAGV